MPTVTLKSNLQLLRESCRRSLTLFHGVFLVSLSGVVFLSFRILLYQNEKAKSHLRWSCSISTLPSILQTPRRGLLHQTQVCKSWPIIASTWWKFQQPHNAAGVRRSFSGSSKQSKIEWVQNKHIGLAKFVEVQFYDWVVQFFSFHYPKSWNCSFSHLSSILLWCCYKTKQISSSKKGLMGLSHKVVQRLGASLFSTLKWV